MKIFDPCTLDGKPAIYLGEQAGLTIVRLKSDETGGEIAIAPQDVESRVKEVAKKKAD